MKNIQRLCLVALTVLLCLGCSSALCDVDITVYEPEVTLVHIEEQNYVDAGNEVKFEAKFTGRAAPYTCTMSLYNSRAELVEQVQIGPADTDGFGWTKLITQSGMYMVEAIITDAKGEQGSAWSDELYIQAQADLNITVPAPEITQLHIKEQQYTPNGNQVQFEVKFTGGMGPYTCTMCLYNHVGSEIARTSFDPTDTDGFGWYYTITQGGNYLVDAIITDALGNRSNFAYYETNIDSSPALEITVHEDETDNNSDYDITVREDEPDTADYDITIYPPAVTKLHIKAQRYTSSGNEVMFEVKFSGGSGPYACAMHLYDEGGNEVASANFDPTDTDGFGWYCTISKSGLYVLEANITDALGNQSAPAYQEMTIDSGISTDITVKEEPLQINRLFIESQHYVANGNEVKFVTEFAGGVGPYTCEMQLVSDKGETLESGLIGPSQTGGFGWTQLIEYSRNYVLKATVTDSRGKESSLSSEWMKIESGRVYDITVREEPLQINRVFMESQQYVSGGNEVKFVAEFTGGTGPYTCDMQLVDDAGSTTPSGTIGPAQTGGFGWTVLISNSQNYLVKATVTDANGNQSALNSEWMNIQSGVAQQQTTKWLSGVTNHKQVDSRWANVKVGSRTIGEIGCLITSISNCESYRLQRDVYPDETRNNLAFFNNDLVWASVYKLGYYQLQDTSLLSICNQIDAGRPVIVGGKNSRGGMHWVIVVGYENLDRSNPKPSMLKINDPNTNERTNLGEFRNIYPTDLGAISY